MRPSAGRWSCKSENSRAGVGSWEVGSVSSLFSLAWPCLGGSRGGGFSLLLRASKRRGRGLGHRGAPGTRAGGEAPSGSQARARLRAPSLPFDRGGDWPVSDTAGTGRTKGEGRIRRVSALDSGCNLGYRYRVRRPGQTLRLMKLGYLEVFFFFSFSFFLAKPGNALKVHNCLGRVYTGNGK